MRFKRTTFKSLLGAAAGISLIQSLVWIALTLLALLTHHCVLSAPSYAESGATAATLVKLYFEGSSCKIADSPPEYSDLENLSVMTPYEVSAWVAAYLVMSIVQFVLTYNVFRCRNGADEILKVVIRLWCLVFFMVSLMDLLLSTSFFLDYIQMEDHPNPDVRAMGFIPFVMSLFVGKAFVLWLFNLISSIYLFLWCTCSRGGERGEESQEKPGRGLNHPASYDNFSYRDSPEASPKWRGQVAERAREMELWRQQQRGKRPCPGSFEAVTHFNTEEPLPVSSAAEYKGLDSYACDCHCWKSDADSGEVHPRSCPGHGRDRLKLKSELETKLETLRSSKERLILSPRNLPDFSSDPKNFQHGIRGNPKQREQPVRLPSSLFCEDSMFY